MYREENREPEKIREVTLTKDRRRGERRKKDFAKALRKMRLSKAFMNDNRGWYGDCVHRYADNPIHCSCPMCREKTNAKLSKSKGPVSSSEYTVNGETKKHVRGSRIPSTNHRFGKKNYRVSDRKTVEMMMDKERSWADDLQDDVVNA